MFTKKEVIPNRGSVVIKGDSAESVTISTGSIDFSQPGALEQWRKMKDNPPETTVTVTSIVPVNVTRQFFFKPNGKSETTLTISQAQMPKYQ